MGVHYLNSAEILKQRTINAVVESQVARVAGKSGLASVYSTVAEASAEVAPGSVGEFKLLEKLPLTPGHKTRKARNISADQVIATAERVRLDYFIATGTKGFWGASKLAATPDGGHACDCCGTYDLMQSTYDVMDTLHGSNTTTELRETLAELRKAAGCTVTCGGCTFAPSQTLTFSDWEDIEWQPMAEIGGSLFLQPPNRIHLSELNGIKVVATSPEEKPGGFGECGFTRFNGQASHEVNLGTVKVVKQPNGPEAQANLIGPNLDWIQIDAETRIWSFAFTLEFEGLIQDDGAPFLGIQMRLSSVNPISCSQLQKKHSAIGVHVLPGEGEGGQGSVQIS